MRKLVAPVLVLGMALAIGCAAEEDKRAGGARTGGSSGAGTGGSSSGSGGSSGGSGGSTGAGGSSSSGSGGSSASGGASGTGGSSSGSGGSSSGSGGASGTGGSGSGSGGSGIEAGAADGASSSPGAQEFKSQCEYPVISGFMPSQFCPAYAEICGFTGTGRYTSLADCMSKFRGGANDGDACKAGHLCRAFKMPSMKETDCASSGTAACRN